MSDRDLLQRPVFRVFDVGAQEGHDAPNSRQRALIWEPSAQPAAGEPRRAMDEAMYAVVHHPYSAQHTDELTVWRGERVELLRMHPDDWYLVRNAKGQQGVVPANHLSDPSIDGSDIASSPGSPPNRGPCADGVRNYPSTSGPSARKKEGEVLSDIMSALAEHLDFVSEIKQTPTKSPSAAGPGPEDSPRENQPELWAAGKDEASAVAVSLVFDTGYMMKLTPARRMPSCDDTSLSAGAEEGWFMGDDELLELQRDLAYALSVKHSNVCVLCHGRSIVAGQGTCEVALQGDFPGLSRFGGLSPKQSAVHSARGCFPFLSADHAGGTPQQLVSELAKQLEDDKSRLRGTKWGRLMVHVRVSGPIAHPTVLALQRAKLLEQQRQVALWQMTADSLAAIRTRCLQSSQALETSKAARRRGCHVLNLFSGAALRSKCLRLAAARVMRNHLGRLKGAAFSIWIGLVEWRRVTGTVDMVQYSILMVTCRVLLRGWRRWDEFCRRACAERKIRRNFARKRLRSSVLRWSAEVAHSHHFGAACIRLISNWRAGTARRTLLRWWENVAEIQCLRAEYIHEMFQWWAYRVHQLKGERGVLQGGVEAHEYDANPREWKEAQSKQLMDEKELASDGISFDAAVPFILALDADFDSIGDHDKFKQDVIQDIAVAACLEPSFFQVVAIRAGSVIADIQIAQEAGNPYKAVLCLIGQLNLKDSLLRGGKWTSKATSIGPVSTYKHVQGRTYEQIIKKIGRRWSRLLVWSVWHTWTSNVSELLRQQVALDRATRRLRHNNNLNGVAKAFNTWSINVGELLRQELNLFRITERLRNKGTLNGVANAFNEWAWYGMRSNWLRHTAKKITRKWSFGVVKRAWVTWAQHAAEQTGARSKTKRFLMHWVNSLLGRAIVSWQEHASHSAHFRVLIWTIEGRKLSRIQVVALGRWKHASNVSCAIRQVLKRWMNRRLAMSFSTWREREQLKHAKHARQQVISLRIVRRWMNRELRRSYLRWYEMVYWQKHAKTICRRVINHMQHLRLTRAFNRYHSQVAECKEIKYKLARVLSKWNGSALRLGWDGWLEGMEAQADERARAEAQQEKARRVVLKMLNVSLTHAFEGWVDGTRHQHRARHVCTKVVMRMQSQRLAHAFDRFHDQVEESKETKRKLTRVLSKWNGCALRLGWDGWLEGIQHARQRQRLEDVCTSIVERIINGEVARAFATWTLFTQTHKRSVQAVSRILRHWQAGKLAVAFETWHDHGHEQVRSRGLLTRIAQRWRLRESAAAFYAWKSNADERQRMAHAGGRIMQRWLHYGLAMALDAWRESAQRQRRARGICMRLLQHWRHRAAAAVFETWHAHGRQQRRLEDVCGGIIARMMNIALARAFGSWTLFTQAHKRSVQAVSRIVKQWLAGAGDLGLRMHRRMLAEGFENWSELVRWHFQAHRICEKKREYRRRRIVSGVWCLFSQAVDDRRIQRCKLAKAERRYQLLLPKDVIIELKLAEMTALEGVVQDVTQALDGRHKVIVVGVANDSVEMLIRTSWTQGSHNGRSTLELARDLERQLVDAQSQLMKGVHTGKAVSLKIVSVVGHGMFPSRLQRIAKTLWKSYRWQRLGHVTLVCWREGSQQRRFLHRRCRGLHARMCRARMASVMQMWRSVASRKLWAKHCVLLITGWKLARARLYYFDCWVERMMESYAVADPESDHDRLWRCSKMLI